MRSEAARLLSAVWMLMLVLILFLVTALASHHHDYDWQLVLGLSTFNLPCAHSCCCRSLAKFLGLLPGYHYRFLLSLSV